MQASFKIAIDANEAFRSNLTGIGVYARHLVLHLAAMRSDDDIVFLGIRSGKADAGFVPPGALKLLRSAPYRSIWSQFRLPLHLWTHRYDLFHSLDHKLPRAVPGRTVVTVYDIGFLKFPNTAERIHRERFEWFTRDAVRRASRLCAISQATKDDVCEYFKISPDKVDVVHLGVDLEVYHPAVEPTRRSNPYVLSVGTLQPRKNYLMLFQAFRNLCRARTGPIELLVVGQRGWLWEGIERDVREGDFRDRIHLLGYVPDQHMPGLYAGAAMVVMPSLYEGFGIPPLEAMACGTPVICSNVSSLPEVVGNAGILLSPTDETEWTRAMCELLENPHRRSELRLKGIERAREFSWARTAQNTLALYTRALSD